MNRTAFLDLDLPLTDRREGKVRISWALDRERRLFVTTDRLSAFDRVIAGVPLKGQVLNQLAAWWFDRLADVVEHHVLTVPDPNALIARTATPLPVEVVVRGHITGVTSTSLWTQYASGARVLYGHRLPDGLCKNDPLPAPLVTPTTKGPAGGGATAVHDVPLSVNDVVDRGLVPAALWQRVTDTALELFRRGADVAAATGLVLADTKYEFGLADDGTLLLIDEVHTPDSSRYWIADTLDERRDRGLEPESLDKEVVRRALLEAGYRGEGPPPELAAEVWAATTDRYVTAFETLTGTTFTPGRYPVGPRLMEALPDVP